jgi:hypothetical protein
MLKQSLKMSMGFAERTFGQIKKRSTPVAALLDIGNNSRSLNVSGSWANELLHAGWSLLGLTRFVAHLAYSRSTADRYAVHYCTRGGQPS